MLVHFDLYLPISPTSALGNHLFILYFCEFGFFIHILESHILLSFSLWHFSHYNASKIHPCSCKYQDFLLITEYYSYMYMYVCMYIYIYISHIFFIYLSFGGHLCFIHIFLAIVNNCAMEMKGPVSFWNINFISFRYIIRSEIAASHSFIFEKAPYFFP